MSENEFGSADDYFKAFEALQEEGIHENHIALLKAHFKAPKHTTTWARLAKAVGYPGGDAVNMQYGALTRNSRETQELLAFSPRRLGKGPRPREWAYRLRSPSSCDRSVDSARHSPDKPAIK